MLDPDKTRSESRELVPFLLRRLKAGIDRDESFRQLFEIYYPRVRSSFSHLPRPEERKDLTQEVFLRVYRGLKGCPEDIEGFDRWLSTVIHNVLRTWFQRSQRLKRRGWEVSLAGTSGQDGAEVPEIKDPREPPQGTALKRLLEGERARLLHEAVLKMPEQMRACVLLRVGQDRSYREIASLLGLAEGTVKAHLNRAREWLRTALSAYFKDFEL